MSKQSEHVRDHILKALRFYLRFEDGKSLLEGLKGEWAPGNIMRLHYLDKQLTQKEMLGDTLQKHNQALKEVDEKLKQILTLTSSPP